MEEAWAESGCYCSNRREGYTKERLDDKVLEECMDQ
jgi:hypothetical protein